MAKDHFQHESLVTDLALSQLRRNPKVQWITYPSLDAYNHIHGTDSTYFQLLRHLDHEIGRLFKDIEFLNQKDRMIAVVSDHGISDVKVNLDIQKMLKDKLNLDFERGESTHLDTEHLSTLLTDFINKDGYFVINGNLSAYLYMTDPNEVDDKKWRKKQYGKNLENYSVDQRKINLPLFISQQKGIDIVAFAHDNNTISFYKNGNKASVTRSRNGEFLYHYEKIDPLGLEEYIEKEKLYTQEDLLVLTKDHEYPFVLPRLFNLISGSDSPDMVMTSLPGYDLADDYEIFVGDYKGGHGGIRKELINVPYILYTPGEQLKISEVARSEDIGATIIQYLGM